MPEAIVIGAGIAGIAIAIRLSVKGYKVAVFEANSYPGGKIGEVVQDGFRFDAGPSLFTMPQYVDELFRLAGKTPAEYFSYSRLDTVCKYFYEDGTRINAWADKLKFAAEIEQNTIDNALSVQRFFERSSRIYDITSHIFLEKSLHKISSYLNKNTLKSVMRFASIDPFRKMNAANEALFRDSKTLRIFNRYATYNGSDPYRAPATLNVIPHLEQHFGAYFPHGGMAAIPNSLVRLAEDCGVRFYYNQPVDEIVVEQGMVKGIKQGGQFHRAEYVISNADVWFTYKKLLKGFKPPARLLKQERSSSALVFYWGIQKQFPELELHNIFFSEDYREEFRQIQEGSVGSDPTVYINISSKIRESDAPPGCENWFVMINVPANSGQDWDALIAQARLNILEKLSRNLDLNVADLIVSEKILDPRSIESQTASYRGSLYGTSSNSKMAAFMRHANFSSKIRGLYFAGGSVHPGGGIPLALLSAKIVDGLIPKVH